jgi:hypothetical protein
MRFTNRSFYPRGLISGTHWLGTKAGMNDVEGGNSHSLPGLEFRRLCRPFRSQKWIFGLN